MIAIIDHLWQSTVAAVPAAAFAYALRDREARVRYWVWFAASMKFLVPFAMLAAIGSQLEWRAAPAPARSLAPTWLAVAEQVAQPATSLTLAVAPAAARSDGDDDGGGASAILGAVWLFGFALVLGRWIERWLRLRRLVRSATPVVLEPLARLGIEVRVARSKIEPGIVGILRPVLVLPQGLSERLTPPQLAAVIEHELSHVRRRDNLTAAMHMAVAAVLWFHPLVWWIGGRLLAERERACDEAVVASGADAGAYARAIIEVCRFYVESPLPCAAGIGGGAMLQARVRSIAENRAVPRLGRGWRAALVTAAIGAVGAPIAIGVLEAPSVAAQPADAESAISAATIAEGDSETGYTISMQYGVLTTRNETLRRLIAFAYDLQNYEIIGPPELDTRRYSIHVRIPDAEPSTDNYRAVMRGLLEQRFGLEIHMETRRVPTLVLRRSSDELGPGIVRVARNSIGGGAYSRRGERSWTVTNQPLRSLSAWLSNVLRKPVVDETRLRESYSYEVQWESSAAPDTGAEPTQDQLTRALESQLGIALTESPRRIELVVVDRFTEPSDPLTAKTPMRLPSEVLDRYIGYYGLGPDRIMTVRRRDDHLLAEPLGESPMALYPLDEARFFTTAGDVDVTFVEGRVPQLFLIRNDSAMSARRLDLATGEARLAELRARIERQAPAPRGEEVARGIARDLAVAEPVRSVRDFAGILRDELRSEAPTAFAERGALRSVTFKRVAPTGRDVYEIAFASLTFEVALGFDAAGNVATLGRVPAGTP